MRYQGITFRELCVIMLRRWRGIMIFALILAVLAGGTIGGKRAVGLYRETSKSDEQRQQEEAAVLKELDAKQLEADSLRAQVSAKESLITQLQEKNDRLEKDLADRTDQVANSVYMKLDPYYIPVCETYFRVDTGYQIMPGMAYQTPDQTKEILGAYEVIFSNNEFLQQMIDDLDLQTEPRYIYDVVVVAPYHDTSSLILRVSGETEEWVKKVTDYVCDHIMDSQAHVAATVGSHTLTKYFSKQYIGLSPDLFEAQERQRTAMNDIRNDILSTNSTIIETQDSLSALRDELSALEGEIAAIQSNPSASAYTIHSVISGFVKFAVLGLVMGIVLGAVMVLVLDTFTGRLLSVEQCTALTSAVFFGTWLSDPKKKNVFSALGRKIDGWVARLGGTAFAGMTSEKAKELVLSNLEAATSAFSGTLLLCGGAPAEKLQEIAAALQERKPDLKISCSGALSTDAATVQNLSVCDGVVLVESFKTSRANNISVFYDRASAQDKPTLGFVLV